MVESKVDRQKLISALYEISKENFSVSDDTILDKLYVHIENSDSVKDILHSILAEVGDWLEFVVNGWNKNELFYGVKIFAIRFIGFIGSSIGGFAMLKSKNILDHIEKLALNIEIQNDSCLMVPIINVLTMSLKHYGGWKWLIEKEVWRCAMKAFYDDRSLYINRSVIKFISLLLCTSNHYSNGVAEELLQTVCEPLILNHLLIVEPRKGSDKSNTGKFNSGGIVSSSGSLMRAAKFVCDILEDLLLSNSYVPGILSTVLKSNGNGAVTEILKNCSSSEACQIYSKLLLMVDLSIAFKNTYRGIEECPLQPAFLNIYSVLTSMNNNGLYNSAIHFCVTCLSWWYKFKLRDDSCSSSCTCCDDFEEALTNLLRHFLNFHRYCFENRKNCICQIFDAAEYYDDAVLDSFYESVKEVCRAIRPSQNLSFQYFQLGLFGISRSIAFITTQKSKMKIFSDVLKAFDTLLKHFAENQALTNAALLHLITLATTLIRDDRLPYWIIDEENNGNFFTTILTILGVNCDDPRITISTLQVLNKMLSFHIMPDLLCKVMMIKHVNVRVQLCNLSMLIVKLDSDSWEIRDTTLEVFQKMTELAQLTPWFFIDLFRSDLLNKILEVAGNDESAYVRASAMNFFSMTVRAKLFSDVISPTSLCDLSIRTLLEDVMPVARIAACDLISALHITYVPTMLNEANKMYEAVFMATLKDLDWEVKKATLKFWHCTINKLLSDELIPIDPSFLSFSKNTKAKEETTSQIAEVLKTLGEIGCLKAICLGVNDDCDIHVSEEAIVVMGCLNDLDEKWNLVEYLSSHDDNIDKEMEAEVSSKKLRLDNKEMNIPNKVLEPIGFFHFLHSQEWWEKFKSRKIWIENTCDDLTFLLDHILNADNRIDDSDHNAVDCY